MASWGSYVFELCRINANQGLTAEIDWNYTSWSRRCRKILIGLVVRGAKTVVVRGKNRILTQNREKLEMTVPISYYESPRPSSSAPGLWDKKSQSSGHRDQMCGHTPGKVAGRQETVKAEMNGLTPGLDRSPPPRWMGGQGGQSLKVFGRTRSFWGLSSPKIEMGGKALKWLSRLDYPLAKTGETVNGGAESAVHLDR